MIEEEWKTSPEPSYLALKSLSLGAVRRGFSPLVRERSMARAWSWYVVDLGLYLGFVAAVYAVDPVWQKLLLGVGAGIAVSMLFLWAHDAAHGSLFERDGVAVVFGTAAMLPSLNIYPLWQYGHNRVHHGFTSLSPIDWIWRPLSPSEYLQRTWWQRFVYRRERSLPGCALHYFLRVWWPGMIRFSLDLSGRNKADGRGSKLLTLVFALGASSLAFRYGGGVWGLVAAVIVPFIVFNYAIAFITFLHHTHPQIPFFVDRGEWSAVIGQVFCSTVVRCSRPAEALLHGILIHVPHHVDTRIPFYRLQRAFEELDPAFRAFVHEYRFRWTTARGIFRECQLFDFTEKVWHRFDDAALIPETRITAPLNSGQLSYTSS